MTGTTRLGTMLNSTLRRRIAPLFSLAALAAVSSSQVVGWGNNTSGQLLTSNAYEVNPISIAALAGARSISAGRAHVVALQADGTVVAFGNNSAAQAGQPAAAPSVVAAPNAIAGLPTNVASVYAGEFTSYALTADGTLYGWGGSGWGELGNGLDSFSDPNGYYPAAAPVPGATNVRKVYTNYSTLGIIKNDGTVWAAGYNYYYTLGLGDQQNRKVLTQIPELTGAKDIAMAVDHGLAAMADGSVKVWGGSNYGYSFHRATGFAETLPRPVPLPGISDVVQVAASDTVGFLRTSDGRLFSMGSDYDPARGYDLRNTAPGPIQIPNLPPIADVRAADNTVYALATDGRVFAWGARNGLGSPAPSDQFEPRVVPGILPASRVYAGLEYGLAQSVSAKLAGFNLLETITRGYRNVRATVTLDSPAGPGGVVVNLVSRAAGNSIPNGQPNTVGTALHVSGAPSPNPAGERLWVVRNRTAFTRTYQFWVFLTGVGWEGTVPPNSDAYFVTSRTWSPLGILFENGRAVDIALTDPRTGPVPTNLFASVAVPATVTVPEGQTSLQFDVFANEVPIQSSVEIVASKGSESFVKTLTIKKESDRPTP